MKYKIGDEFECIKDVEIQSALFKKGEIYKIYDLCEYTLKWEGTGFHNNIKMFNEHLEKGYFKDVTTSLDKQEFEVKELGYYKRADGLLVKVVHIMDKGTDGRTVVGIVYTFDRSEVTSFWYKNGKWAQNRTTTDLDLVRYRGPEIKEPIKFEFEAITKNYNHPFCSPCILIPLGGNPAYQILDKKFKVTMEEILE